MTSAGLGTGGYAGPGDMRRNSSEGSQTCLAPRRKVWAETCSLVDSCLDNEGKTRPLPNGQRLSQNHVGIWEF